MAAVEATPSPTGPDRAEVAADAVGSSDGGGSSGGGPAGRAGEGRRPRPIFLLVGVVLAVALGIGLFTGIGTGRSAGRPEAGGAVPTFTLPRLGGGPAVGVPADGGGNGHPAVLLFFASWCVPCQAEVPAIAAAYHHQQAVGSPLAKVALIGIAGSDPTSTALRFVHKSGVTFPVGADRTYAVTEGLFYFTDLPEAVFVNGDGVVAAVHYGAISTAALVQWEQRLLSGG